MTAPWSWMEHASCRDHPLELWFAPEGEREQDRTAREAQARQICNGCPVKLPCLTYRLTQPRQQDGVIWGGLDGDERNVELRRRQRAARKQAAA